VDYISIQTTKACTLLKSCNLMSKEGEGYVNPLDGLKLDKQGMLSKYQGGSICPTTFRQLAFWSSNRSWSFSTNTASDWSSPCQWIVPINAMPQLL